MIKRVYDKQFIHTCGAISVNLVKYTEYFETGRVRMKEFWLEEVRDDGSVLSCSKSYKTLVGLQNAYSQLKLN